MKRRQKKKNATHASKDNKNISNRLKKKELKAQCFPIQKKKKLNRTECKSKTEKGERKFRSCFILYTITAYYCSFLCVFFVFVQFCCFSFCCCCYQCGRCRDTHLRFFQFFSPFFHLRRGKAVQRRMEKTTATLKKKEEATNRSKKKSSHL